MTYFMGSDILDYDAKEALFDFFINLNNEKNDLDTRLQDLRNNF